MKVMSLIKAQRWQWPILRGKLYRLWA